MSAPPKRAEEYFRPEKRRAMAEGIRGTFIAAAKGQSAEARRNLGSETMEALEALFNVSRAREMGRRVCAKILF
jgi:uncharacterized membrane-anchored protein